MLRITGGNTIQTLCSVDKFGESAPEEDVFEAFGISSRTIVDSVLCLLSNDGNNFRG